MKTVAVIPARLESSRLPNKALLDGTGRPLIMHTVEAAREYFDTIVATDSQDIYEAVRDSSDVPVVITGKCHSGSDRARQAIQFLEQLHRVRQYETIINWQADEPELSGRYVQEATKKLEDKEADIITLAAPIQPDKFYSPDTVKVVIDRHNMAMYFSRAPIPYEGPHRGLHHVGVYIFRYEILGSMGTIDDTVYKTEKLEQLKWLESGLRVKVHTIPEAPESINTSEDYRRFVSRNAK